MFDGTETMLPLAWDTDGRTHDNARKYLTKRHCLCCHSAGFRGVTCPVCIRNNCPKCLGRPDKEVIIPCFYLRKDDVPFPVKFYGDIDCFLQFCTRKGGQGFKSQEDMRIHARSRHRMEYQAYMETLQADKADEVDKLREQVNLLLGNQIQPNYRVGQLLKGATVEVADLPAVTPHAHQYGKAMGAQCSHEGCLSVRQRPFKKRKSK